MPPKVRQRGKKPSKLRKLQEGQVESEQGQHDESQPVASTSLAASNNIQNQADYIALDDNVSTGNGSAQPQEEDGQPNWVRLGERSSKAEHEAPFGYVDAELKAYLRAGWEHAVELESQGYTAKSTLTALAAAAVGAADSTRAADNQDEEQEDELALLLQATLKEMDGKELLLSTDPDTSLIVEGILHRLPAKPLRVFVDRLAGNFAVLAKHRFASHVVQACLATLQPAVTLEHATQNHFQQHQHSSASNGKAAASSAFASDTATIVNEDGILRSATQLILDIADELASDQALLASLVSDAFGSHVLRSLLCVLTGRNIQTDTGSSAHTAAASDLRSRRSAKFRTRKAPTSVAGTGASEDLLVVVPDLLFDRATSLRQGILGEASTEVVRRWAADAVASPLLQLLIEAEADALDDVDGENKWNGSLVDSLLGGFLSTSAPASEGEDEATRDVYLETSLRDSVASHALQLALERAPSSATARFFAIYIRGRMAKLCIHPAANHIVAALLRRLAPAELAAAIAEMGKVATGMVKEQMVGCLQAAVDRVGQLVAEPAAAEAKKLAKAVSEVVLGAFRLKAKAESAAEGQMEEGVKMLVPTMLALKTRKAYLHTYAARAKQGDEAEEGHGQKRTRDGKSSKSKKAKHAKKHDEGESEDEQAAWMMDEAYELPASEATVQGSLLLQSLLRLPGPSTVKGPVKRTFGRPTPAVAAAPVEVFGSALVLESLLALPTLAPFARNPTAVHTLIAALTPISAAAASEGLDAGQAARRRKLGAALVAQLAHFCGDKYGSRLADQLWYTSDGYSKEKIAKAVVEDSATILRGAYAGYFTNKLQLQLYRKGKLREWTQAVQAQQPPAPARDAPQQGGVVRHRPIVVTTARKPGKKTKKAKIDGELDAILGGI